MRWHVYGTDAATGQAVVLGVNDADAAHAVQAAMARRILVSRVVRGGWLGLLKKESLRRAVLPLLAAAVIVLLPLAGALYYDHRTTMRNLPAAQSDRSQLAFSLREAEAMLRISQTKLVQLEAGGAGPARQLERELEAARQALGAREEELAAARGNAAALEKAAEAVGGLKTDLEATRKKLADAQGRIKALDAQAADQRAKLAALDEARKKAATAEAAAAKLEAQNRALAGQIDLLKGQLLELAAHSDGDLKTMGNAADPSASVPGARRLWGLRPDYDTASDFAALHFGKDSVQATANAGGLVTITATTAANACTFSMKTDRHRVFAATLKVSFAAEAPAEKRVQNTQVLAAFGQTFAPGWKNAVPALNAAMQALADKDADQRLVLLGDDYKATISNNKLGLYTIRIESPRDTLDED